MRRPSSVLILLTGLLLVLAACGGSPSGSPGASSDNEPGASEPAASEPAASEPEASEDGGGGGGGGGIGVTLSAGSWTGGEADVDISGDATASFGAPLFAPTSITDGGSTTLTYVSADGGAIGIGIYTDSFAISVTTAEMVGGGGTTTTCTVNWHSTDDNNISGDFSCPNSPAFTTTGGAAGTVDIEGSFTATR